MEPDERRRKIAEFLARKFGCPIEKVECRVVSSEELSAAFAHAKFRALYAMLDPEPNPKHMGEAQELLARFRL